MSDVNEKFLKGEKLTGAELIKLPLVDQCRYVVTKHFEGGGFSTAEVTYKLNELHPDGVAAGHYSPMEVRKALVEYFGEP